MASFSSESAAHIGATADKKISEIAQFLVFLIIVLKTHFDTKKVVLAHFSTGFEITLFANISGGIQANGRVLN